MTKRKIPNGILPSMAWLKENGYPGLVAAMQQHPEKFEHIFKDKHLRRIEEHILTAEKLAKDNNGILPTFTWLKKNGYQYLAVALHKHPESFKHILRERHFKTLEEHIETAESLAKDNGGILPRLYLLQEDLRHAVNDHKEYFKHIKQHPPRTTLKEIIKEAELLAFQNEGELPPSNVLKKSENKKHKSIGVAIGKYPEEFAHIPRRSKRSISYYVHEAERICQQNNGILPSKCQLIKNGRGDICHQMRKHPEHFSHISIEDGAEKKKQETKIRHLSTADKLLEINNGVLPSANLLKENGHSAFYAYKKVHPEYFTHIQLE